MAGEIEHHDKDRLISLAKASDLYGFNQAYLATLARKGRLKAIKPGSEWLPTPADMETFINSRQRRGVFREDVQVSD